MTLPISIVFNFYTQASDVIYTCMSALFWLNQLQVKILKDRSEDGEDRNTFFTDEFQAKIPADVPDLNKSKMTAMCTLCITLVLG